MTDQRDGEWLFAMPSLGADMDDGIILEWRVQPGAAVHRGDIVAVVQTDKADLDVESFGDGTVEELLVPPGERVAVGTPLARLRGSGALESAAAPASPTVATVAVTPMARPAKTTPARAAKRRTTPRARRLAAVHGVDLGRLVPPGGVITGDAVLRASTRPSPRPAGRPARQAAAPAPTADAMRAAIARVVERSWREIPHYEVSSRIELGGPLAWLVARNASRPPAERVLPAALLAWAAARAAVDVPELNGTWVEGQFVPAAKVDLGVLVSLRAGGLLAPVVRDAAARDLDGFMTQLRDLVSRARAGRLKASELEGASITVTDLGDHGAEKVRPIIHPPQVAILGLGRVHDEPWAERGLLGVRPVVHATLAVDHRVVDGRLASDYVAAYARHLQEVTST